MARQRYSDEEVLKLLREIDLDAHNDDAVVLMLGFLLYTGARRHGTFTAEWQKPLHHTQQLCCEYNCKCQAFVAAV